MLQRIRALAAAAVPVDKSKKTDTSPPNFKEPPKCNLGDYCFMAKTEFSDGSMEFTGYNTTMDITDDVEDICIRNASVRNGKECNPVRLTFLKGKHPKCNGTIDVNFKRN